MSAVHYDGWKAIAVALERSTTFAKKMAGRSEDRLPVFKIGGTVRLTAAGLAAWLARQETKRYGCEGGCDDVGAP